MTLGPNTLNHLIQDLVFLRKGLGLEAERFFAATTLEEVCGGPQPSETLRERLLSALHSLPRGQNREALFAAYGLLPATRGLATLSARRGAYGRLVIRGPDTLADRESAAIKELALRLLVAYSTGSPLPAESPIHNGFTLREELPIVVQSPLPAKLPIDTGPLSSAVRSLPYGGYLIEYLSLTTIYRDRKFTEQQHRRRIISLLDGAAALLYVSRNEIGRARMILVDPDNCAVETTHVPGASMHTVYFDPVKRGDTREFSFREVPENPEAQEGAPLIDFAGHSFKTPTLVYAQQVIFFGGRPPIGWTYKNSSWLEGPGTPEENEVLRFENDASLRKEFYNLRLGMSAGLAWRWE